VMLVDHKLPKLADFGIASVKDDPKITATGMVLGSPQFMAPEQAEGVETGPASDLWGLGATLYWAVEGEHPFDRNGPIPTLAAVVHDEPRPMRRSGGLTPTISALLSKDPSKRPSGSTLRRMLLAAAGRDEPLVTPHAPVAPPPAPRGGSREPTVSPTQRTAPATSWPAGRPLLVALVLLLLAGVAVFVLTRSADDARTPATDENRGSSRGQGPGGEERAGSDDETSGGLPEGWTSYRDSGTGWQISYPEGWAVEPQDESMIDFRDPSTGTYLRVDWTDAPGDDAAAAWEQSSANFGSTHDNYDEIAITPTNYKEYDEAALWEYTYSEGGADLHAYNLGFVVDDEWGFALNFQTHEEDWESSQELFEQFKATWQPPD
jgi:hypothetical protein